MHPGRTDAARRDGRLYALCENLTEPQPGRKFELRDLPDPRPTRDETRRERPSGVAIGGHGAAGGGWDLGGRQPTGYTGYVWWAGSGLQL